MSKFLRHQSCPECPSSDGLAVYEDGSSHCFACGYHPKTKNGEHEIENNKARHAIDRELTRLPSVPQGPIDDRKLSAIAADKFNVTINRDPASPVDHIYPYFDEHGAHVANKKRRKGEKAFFWEGDTKASVLFGQTSFPAGGKAITITEGELDALAVYDLFGNRYPCVSVKSASEAKRNCAEQLEYLQSFEDIVICFDNDDPGQKAALDVAQMFKPGQCRILKLQEGKDANDYLMKGINTAKFRDEWWKAVPYMPDGLLAGSDPRLLDDIINYKEPHSIPYPWNGLNKALYGLRLSEFTLFTADTGIGKTTFMKEIEYQLLQDEELKRREYGIGFLHLEEPKRETALGLMSIHNNKPYHLPDVPKSTEELTKAYDEVVNTDRVVIWDHFGSNDIDVVLNKIRHMVALGCRYIVIDHLSIIVSDQSGDERKQLDEISTKLKTLTMNLAICVVAVIHINRKGEVRGSAGPEQVSNNVIRLERDKRDANPWRRNITRMVVEKCRLSGRTGPAAWVFYDEETGRLNELTKEQIDEFESGGTGAGQEF